MAQIKNITLDSVRIIPRDSGFLDRKLGARGEVFFDEDTNTLRLFDGVIPGGIPLLKADFSNADGVIGAAVAETAPTGSNISPGTIWFNTTNGRLYILYNDGTSTQWVQPTTPSYGAGGGGGASSLTDLTDIQISSPTTGQVLKYNGTAWVNGTDNVGTGGGGAGATTLDELSDVILSTPSYQQVLQYNGTTWVNSTLITGATNLDGLSDVAISSPTTNQVLKYNGTNWVNSTQTAAATDFALLTEVVATTNLTIDKIYLPAITMLVVTPNGATSYLFDQYSGNNPTIYAINGTTIAFNLQCSGHPFAIQDSTGTNYSLGLYHVDTGGVVSTGINAQGKTSGTLYWKIPSTVTGNYRYQCTAHIAMVGAISVKTFASI